MQTSVESLIRSVDWTYEEAGTRWQDGMILGNGNLGVIGYAPYGLEWVLNKGDVFDGRTCKGKLLPHAEVMKRFFSEHRTTMGFLEAEEAAPSGVGVPLSKSAALLRLRFGEEVSWNAVRPHKTSSRLCFWEGTQYWDLDMHLSHPRLRCLAPRGRNLFCLRLENSGAAVWDHIVELARPADDDLKAPRWHSGDNWLALTQEMPQGKASYAVVVMVIPTEGPSKNDLFQKSISPCWRKQTSSVGAPTFNNLHGQIPQGGNCDIFVSIYTSYETDNPLEAALREARKAGREGFPRLERENRKWWNNFWKQAWVDFGKHREIQRYWTSSLFETACIFGKAPMPGLYGFWYGPTDQPRSGVSASWYTHDQNIQMPAMPLFVTNHPELIEPFADSYLNVIDVIRRETRECFGKKGIVIPLTMNQLGQQITGGAYRYSLCGGAYSGLLLAWAWKFTRDRKLLEKRIYPLLREIVEFYVDGMRLKENGRYQLDWEIPPEIYTLSRDTTATLALLRPCLETAVEGSALLRRDAGERRKWEDILAHYPEFPCRKNGDHATSLGAGWWAGADIPHDHYTQAAYLLYPFFPGEAASGKNGEAAAALTLAAMPEHDCEMSYADQDGKWHYKRSWAWFFPAMTAIRLGRRKQGWQCLQECLRCYSKPNGLFTHDPVIEAAPEITEHNLRSIAKRKVRMADGSYAPVSEFRCHDSGSAATLHSQARRWVTPASEGNGAFLLAATETMLQSHNELIRLFPCVPHDFSGSFENLRAQGAFLVSAEMKKGVLMKCRIKALAGGTARIKWECCGLPERHGSKGNMNIVEGHKIVERSMHKHEIWIVK